jgi:hypothetical protein
MVQNARAGRFLQNQPSRLTTSPVRLKSAETAMKRLIGGVGHNAVNRELGARTFKGDYRSPPTTATTAVGWISFVLGSTSSDLRPSGSRFPSCGRAHRFCCAAPGLIVAVAGSLTAVIDTVTGVLPGNRSLASGCRLATGAASPWRSCELHGGDGFHAMIT